MPSSICRSGDCPSRTAIAIESAGSLAFAAAHVCWSTSATANSTSFFNSVASRPFSVSQSWSIARAMRFLSSGVNLVGWEKSSVRMRSSAGCRCPASASGASDDSSVSAATAWLSELMPLSSDRCLREVCPKSS